MKLRNKKTGEIVEYDNIFFYKLTCKGNEKFMPNAQTISELNEDWEDYKEDELYFCITSMRNHNEPLNQFDISIGNYFKTKEEAEKAVEKLRAWKRLKDKGLTFCGWKITDDGCSVDVETTLDAEIVRAQQKYITDDLDLLFGGEE